jgi:long-chain acyl-CoA synthetase
VIVEPPGRQRPGRAAAWLAKQVEVGLAAVELSAPQYRVLALLDEGSAGSSALAERLAVRPPSVTAVVDGLVARRLVERRPIGGDRRRVGLTLTAAGRRVLAQADRAVDARLTAIAGALPGPDGGQAALDSLLVWREALAAHREAARREAAQREAAQLEAAHREKEPVL